MAAAGRDRVVVLKWGLCEPGMSVLQVTPAAYRRLLSVGISLAACYARPTSWRFSGMATVDLAVTGAVNARNYLAVSHGKEKVYGSIP
jgi:hypothetical protein